MCVGCKLVQFVVYCMLLVMMSTNIEKNSSVSEEGHVLIAYGFHLVVSLASMQIKIDQELLKSLCQNKTPDLSLKCMLIQVHDQRVQQ